MIIRAFHPITGSVLRVWSGYGEVDVAFDKRVPTSAGISHEQGAGDLYHTASLPDGYAALLEVDARAEGVPLTWLGQLGPWDDADDDAEINISADGPQAWLETLGIHDMAPIRAPAGTIARWVFSTHPGRHRVVIGRIHVGELVEINLSGMSLWQVLEELAKLSGEDWTLTPIPGTATLRLDWWSALDVPDARRQATLYPGVNCERTARTGNMGAGLDEMVGVALSVVQGVKAQSGAVRLGSRVIGRHAALTVARRAHFAAQLAGGPVVMSPASPSFDTARQALQAALVQRRPDGGGSAEITDEDLFALLRPRAVLSAVFPRDTIGFYRRAAVQLRTTTWTIPKAANFVSQCSTTFELWSMEAAA